MLKAFTLNREVDITISHRCLDKALFLGNLGEYWPITINDISLKLDSLGYITIADSVGLPLPSTTLMQ